MSVPTRRILDPIFGEPVIRYDHNGMGGWCKENSLTQWQKGGGWTANLYGGVQTNDDWAAVFIPVNEFRVDGFEHAQWSYYMTQAQQYGVNIVFWVHDPTDLEKRAEITQLGSVSGLAKAAGWNKHVFNAATTQMFFYGEGTTGTGLDAGTRYTWNQFQADAIFSTWTIYRISIEYGWIASGTFLDVWLAELFLDNQRILLKPSAGDHVGGEVKSFAKETATNSTTKATLVTPAAAKRIRVISVRVMTVNTNAASYEMYFGTAGSMGADMTKAIFITNIAAATAGYLPTDGDVFPYDSQPVGAIGEVVSMRTSADMGTTGTFLITYREE